MNIKEYEKNINNEVSNVILQIINENKSLAISSKSRAGAEVSDFLEKQFVNYTKESNILLKSEQAPKGKTKNPWDAKTFYKCKNHNEEIWIDFKAFKITETSDSNPDIGTPNKIFKFIEEGGFYLLYVYVYYKEKDEGLEFVEYKGNYVKSYFLKDISSTVRRTSSNQLQVNIDAEPEYRTRTEFIKLLNKKVLKGLERQLVNAQKTLVNVRNNEENLIKINKTSEQNILNSIS